MWKLITGIIDNGIYEYLEMYNLLQVKQKECKKTAEGQKIT